MTEKQYKKELELFRLLYTRNNHWNGFKWCYQTEQKVLYGFIRYLLEKENDKKIS